MKAVLASALGGVSLLCIGLNYQLLWRSLRAKPGERMPSMIPIVGGATGFFALKLFLGMRGEYPWWGPWLAPLLDPGCYVAPLPVLLIAGLLRRRRP